VKHLLLLTLLAATAAHAEATSIAGWRFGSHAGDAYRVAIDPDAHGGKAAAMITAAPGRANDFASLTQAFAPGELAGKRVRMSAWVKSEKVGGWAGLWMRVDGTGRNVLSFDNMEPRGIKGTTDWAKYDVVLDVPADAAYIVFGALLSGRGGAVWVDDFTFEVVDKSVLTTTTLDAPVTPTPTNLDFER
jgi:hypothetical protein